MSLCPRTETEWREAFIKFRGSARHLFRFQTNTLESGARHAALNADPRSLVRLDETIVGDEMSHRLVMVQPLLESRPNGARAYKRDAMVSQVISPFIFHLLYARQQKEINSNLVIYLKTAITQNYATSGDGFVFEGYGHAYVVDQLRRRSIHVRSLENQTPQALGPYPLIENEKCFDGTVIPTTCEIGYYRPEASNFEGIDSFAVLKQPYVPRNTIILFQFTLSKSHNIGIRYLQEWVKNASGSVEDWCWMLVFVVPKEIEPAYSKQKYTLNRRFVKGGTCDIIAQYVWGIDVNEFLVIGQ
ncbi:hypothetical protein F5880DRAFT_704782 [Lentinula raphanica]|nr:hypothetical protein F5880DRAFT_704782 [Lentinula raphanica]